MGRILVIEDEPDVARLVETVLVRAGHVVTMAANGLEALVAIDRMQRKPHLLITDITMPELDGLSLVRALRSHPETRKIPIIFLTGRGDAKSVAEGISLGARYYLTKPFKVDDLVARVAKALGK
jgi:two-component system, chemotaxis family, chemotaxis protein CheY